MSRPIPISTEIGIVSGRDAIYLHSIDVPDQCTLELSGEFNCALASKPPPPPTEWQAYRIRFDDVIAFQAVELDTWEALQHHEMSAPASSFYEVTGSRWLARMRDPNGPESKAEPEHRHLVFQTYDLVFEVVCTNYKLDMKGTRA